MVRVTVWLSGILFVMLALTAVAGDKDREPLLKKRVEAYWEALRINDVHTVYYMEMGTVEKRLTPDVMRALLSPPYRLVDYKVKEVKASGDEGEAIIEIELTSSDLAGKSFSAPSQKERWTFINDNWYHGGPAEKSDPKTSSAPQGK